MIKISHWFRHNPADSDEGYLQVHLMSHTAAELEELQNWCDASLTSKFKLVRFNNNYTVNDQNMVSTLAVVDDSDATKVLLTWA